MTIDYDDLCKRLREDASRWSDDMVMASLEREAADSIVALQADNAVLRQDAERYRWVRKQQYTDVASESPFYLPRTPEEIDADIDAAMREGKG